MLFFAISSVLTPKILAHTETKRIALHTSLRSAKKWAWKPTSIPLWISQTLNITLIISPEGDPFMLQQALSFNAGIRVSLLAVAFTRPTRESDHLFFRTGSHQPPALWSRGAKDEFSVNVFLHLCHLSTKQNVCQCLFFAKTEKHLYFYEKHLTFDCIHGTVTSILEKALTKTA